MDKICVQELDVSASQQHVGLQRVDPAIGGPPAGKVCEGNEVLWIFVMDAVFVLSNHLQHRRH